MILAIDLGTTATKVSLVSPDMQVKASSQRRIQTYSLPEGGSEQDPSDWIHAIVACVAELHGQIQQLGRSIEVIAVTGHMLGCLPVDKVGNPLHRHLLHSDTRARRQAANIENILGPGQIYQLTGNRAGPSSLAKILWFKETLPMIYQKTQTFLQAKDYVTGWLTGNFDRTDFSDASHACLINIRTLAYFDDVYQALDLDQNKLPKLFRGTDVSGHLRPKIADLLGLPAGLPVIVGAGDGACSALGAGAAAAGDHYCCIGTTAWIACLTETPTLDEQGRNFFIASGDGRSVGSFGTVQSAGKAIEWAQSAFRVASLKEFDALAQSCAPGADGLIFLPYLEGERTPHFDPDARGAFVGLSSHHQTDHLVRAVMEGVSMALRDTATLHRENGIQINSLKVIGGGARSDAWQTILSNVLGVPLTRLASPSEHATTVGAAILAGVAIRYFSDLSSGVAKLSELDTFEPDRLVHQQYNELYPIYQSLYQALDPANKNLARYRQSHVT